MIKKINGHTGQHLPMILSVRQLQGIVLELLMIKASVITQQ
jgi:hypothetical protein